MTLIINHELFTLQNISNEEFVKLYIMIDGWYAFLFFDKKAAYNYIIDAILDVIGRNVDIVTLEKESLFTKLKKIIEFKKFNIPYKEVNGITTDDYKYNFNFKIKYDFDIKYKIKYDFDINFKDFENKYKYEDFEDLNLPELSIEDKEKENDLNVFGIEYNRSNISEKHMFLVNNLKTLYYKKAKICHPDKGGNVEEFKNLSNAYERLIKLRDA